MPADLNTLKQDLTRRMDGALETLRREFAGVPAKEVDSLLYVRKIQNVFDGVLPAAVYQLHHQVVIGNAKVVESAKAGTRIH